MLRRLCRSIGDLERRGLRPEEQARVLVKRVRLQPTRAGDRWAAADLDLVQHEGFLRCESIPRLAKLPSGVGSSESPVKVRYCKIKNPPTRLRRPVDLVIFLVSDKGSLSDTRTLFHPQSYHTAYTRRVHSSEPL